ncbi:MAG: hypothetical protein V7645_1646, partial [Actinomycetota bacterium]
MTPTTDAVQSTASALPSATDGPTLTSGTDPAGTLNSIAPSTDLSTAPTPETTLPVLDPTVTDPAGTLTSIVPSTDLSTAPAPDITTLPVGDAFQLVAGAVEADPGHAASVIATQPVSETVTHAASDLAASLQPLTDPLATAVQPAIDATARTADLAATNSDPVLQALSTADDPVAQTIAAATQPALHATAEGAGVVTGAAQPLVDA